MPIDPTVPKDNDLISTFPAAIREARQIVADYEAGSIPIPGSVVTIVPSGGLESTTAQAALAELDAKKTGMAHSHSGGDGAQIDYSTLAGLPTLPSGDVVGTTDTQTLTGKTISLYDNTVSGTLAQFNAAISDADILDTATAAASFAAALGADDNYVTGAEKVKLANLSGTNTGDQDLSTLATKTEVAAELATKQATLIGGTNIKTLNGSSVLGSGDLVVGHTIQDEGVALAARTNLDFVGTAVTVTDDLANDKTIVTVNVTDITGGSINNTPIGSTTPSTGAFTSLSSVGGVLLQTQSPPEVCNTFTAIGWGNECCWLTGNAYYDNINGQPIPYGNAKFIAGPNGYSNSAGLCEFAGNGGMWNWYTAATTTAGAVINFGVPKMQLTSTGLTVNSLAGSGNRAVYSDANGLLTNSSSDASLKTNVVQITSGLSQVQALRPVSFNWASTSRFGTQREIGFIAQEVREVVPEVIGMNYDGTLSLDYPKLTATLVAAIQELNAKLDAHIQGA